MKVFTVLATTSLSVVATWAILSSVQRPAPEKSPENLPLLRPIAEFEPTFGIGLSEQVLFKKGGMDLLKSFLAADAKVYLLVSRDRKKEITAMLQDRRVLSAEEEEAVVQIQLEHESLWIRDYMPLPVLRLYPHLSPTPSFVDFVYRDGNSFDDAAIHQFAMAINSSVEHLPIVLDGGNFISNGASCIISSEISVDPEIVIAGEPPVQNFVSTVFKEALGCTDTQIVSQIPHPHVDMWMKFLDRETVLVNSIDPRAKALASRLERSDQEKIEEVSRELDMTAKLLEKKFRVVRIPMPLPVNEVLLTFANAVLVNRKAIIPRYRHPKEGQKYVDQDLFSSYEDAVAQVFHQYGYETAFVEADELIRDGGAFHCVTFHLPDLDSILKERGHLAIRSKG